MVEYIDREAFLLCGQESIVYVVVVAYHFSQA